MDDQHSNTHALQRRMVLKGGTAMAVAAPLGLLAIPSPANAEEGAQQDWRFCAKCMAMFWNGAPDKGRCPAGGGHVAQGFQFAIHYDSNRGGADQSQYDWRFCTKCKAMYWDGAPNKGRCPAGGGHLAQGFNFGLNFNNPGGSVQSEWRFCDKCYDLFWNGAAGKGACAAGGGHVAQGFVFAIPYTTGPLDPGKAIADALGVVLPQVLTAVQPAFVQLLGTADLLGKGYTLHAINLRFGRTNVSYNGVRDPLRWRPEGSDPAARLGQTSGAECRRRDHAHLGETARRYGRHRDDGRAVRPNDGAGRAADPGGDEPT